MVNEANQYLEGLSRGEFIPSTYQPDLPRWAAMADQTARVCDQLLEQISPRAALTPTWVGLPDDLLATTGDYGGFNRLRWVLAANATGRRTDIDLLQNYLRRAGRWWGARVVLDRHQEISSDALLSIDGTPGREFLHRTSSQVIRFHWAAERIALEIGRQVEADPQFATYLPDFTEHNVRGCIDSAWYYTRLLDGPPIPLDYPGMSLAQHMSIEAGAGKLKFSEAAVSTRMDASPWVRYSEGLVPIATASVFMAIDRALLAAVDDHLGAAGVRLNKITKGELFERVAQECISQSLAFGGRTLPRECSVTVGNASYDVDVNIANSDTVEIIGEVKAKEPTNRIGTAAAGNFQEQIGEVHEQLSLRLNALADGIALIDGYGARHHGSPDTLGLGIVLHPYSASLGDPDMMDVLEPEHRHWRIATAELHSWILVLSAMETLHELRGYLRFRQDLIDLQVRFSEECDPALVFLEGNGDHLLRLLRTSRDKCPPDRKFAPILNGAQLDTELAISLPPPTDSLQWRTTFCTVTHSVSLPFHLNGDGDGTTGMDVARQP